MTFTEFKCWLEGYCEHIENAPTPEQWARIRDQLSKVQGLTPAATRSGPQEPYRGTLPDRVGTRPSFPSDPFIRWARDGGAA